MTPHRYITGIITERGIFAAAVHRIAEQRCERFRGQRAMNLLGIETSCDETAAAVVEETGDRACRGRFARTSSRRRSPFIASGAASSRSSRRVSTCATSAASSKRALRRRRDDLDDIDAIAVTQGPGLVGSLLVGVAFAKARRLGARTSARSRASSRRTHRITELAHGELRCRRPCSWCPAATPACISVAEPGPYQLSAGPR